MSLRKISNLLKFIDSNRLWQFLIPVIMMAEISLKIDSRINGLCPNYFVNFRVLGRFSPSYPLPIIPAWHSLLLERLESQIAEESKFHRLQEAYDKDELSQRLWNALDSQQKQETNIFSRTTADEIIDTTLFPPSLTRLEADLSVRARTIAQMLDLGADPNAVFGENGDTSLHLAARIANLHLVEMLCKAGADLTKRNNDNETAYDVVSALAIFDEKSPEYVKALTKKYRLEKKDDDLSLEEKLKKCLDDETDCVFLKTDSWESEKTDEVVGTNRIRRGAAPEFSGLRSFMRSRKVQIAAAIALAGILTAYLARSK